MSPISVPTPGSTPRKSARRKSTPRPAFHRKNTKVTGEHSEAGFLFKATFYNFGIAKPWGDSLRYDFILDNGHRLHRIQIKCTECLRAGAYETRATYTVGKGRAAYTKADIDFIAAHVVPLDIWYIIPVEICTPQPMLRFYPHRQAKKMRLEKYREAWNLLQEEENENEEQGRIDLQASADESIYPAIGNGSVILIEGAGPQSGPAPQSKDLCTPPVPPDSKSLPIHLPASAAPWPIPPLKILTTRKGPQILPDPKS